MLKLFLFCLLTVVSKCEERVVIHYEEPLLTFTLPTNDTEISEVIFHYIVNNVGHQVNGVLTTDGWQFQSREISLDGADQVQVYAVTFDVRHNILERTYSTTLKLNDNRDVTQLPPKIPRGAVIFRDDFNSLNTANWKYEVSMYGGGNWEFQVYTNDPKNVFTRGGQLHIQPTLTANDPRFNENFLHQGTMNVAQIWGYCTNYANFGCSREGRYGLLPPVMSGKIMSIPTLRYGIVEIRARIPKGDWLWPAIWMMPRDSAYGRWPRSGEIDIMESRGNTVSIGSVSSTLHWGLGSDSDKFLLTTAEKRTTSWHDSFHTWKLEWRPDRLITFVDNQKILEVNPGAGLWKKGGFSGSNIWASGEKMAPFDKDFYMILNVAVGGVNGYFPDNVNWGVKKPWTNNSPHAADDFWNGRNDWLPTWRGEETAMLIDWVEFRNL